MLGFKIISEKKYRDEQKAVQEIVESNVELTKKNNSLNSDIQSLRVQNSKLRSANIKHKGENEVLVEKNRKLKEQLNEKQDVKFKKQDIKFEEYFTLCTPERCDTCTHEQQDCKKFYLERKTDVICVCQNHPFEGSNL